MAPLGRHGPLGRRSCVVRSLDHGDDRQLIQKKMIGPAARVGQTSHLVTSDICGSIPHAAKRQKEASRELLWLKRASNRTRSDSAKGSLDMGSVVLVEALEFGSTLGF
jgi:hypothetical protein